MLFSTVAVPVYNPNNGGIHILASTDLIATVRGARGLSHCGSNLHFPAKSWASFHMPVGHLYVLLREMSAQATCSFLSWIV